MRLLAADQYWESTDLHCVYCGKQTICCSEWDQEIGYLMACLSCDRQFYSHADRAETSDARVLTDAIRAAQQHASK